jgi:hypothetical protein
MQWVPVGVLFPEAATVALSRTGLPEIEVVPFVDNVVTVGVRAIVSVMIWVDVLPA